MFLIGGAISDLSSYGYARVLSLRRAASGFFSAYGAWYLHAA